MAYALDQSRTDTRSYAERLTRDLDGVELDTLKTFQQRAEVLAATAREGACGARHPKIAKRLRDFAEQLDALTADIIAGGAVAIAEQREVEPA